MSSVCLSVCLSVRPSLMLVDHDHIDWKSWKLIARTISPTLFWGETRGGVGENGVLEHKSGNISDTRKDGGGPIVTHQRSFERYHPRPIRPPLPQHWGFATPPKTPLLSSQERVKLQTSNLAGTFTGRPSEQTPIKNFGEKGAWAYPGTAQNFWVPL